MYLYNKEYNVVVNLRALKQYPTLRVSYLGKEAGMLFFGKTINYAVGSFLVISSGEAARLSFEEIIEQ